MADNDTRLDAASATKTFRTLDRSGVETGIGLLDIAQASEAELLGLGDSRPVTVASAGLTTASTSYAIGDQLGTEMTVASIVRTGRGSVIQDALLIDKAKLIVSVDVFLFSAATTPAADNAANAWSDADMLNCIGILHFSDQVQSANNYILQCTNTPFVVKPGSGTSIYADMVTRTAHSFFGATTDLQLVLAVSRD